MAKRVLVGTGKGAFILSQDQAGGRWELTGPHCGGWPINHVVGEEGSGLLWAGGGSEWHGAGVWRSTDAGRSWTLSKLSNGKFDHWIAENPDIAAGMGFSPAAAAPHTGKVEAIWSIGRSGGRVYAGGKPGMLYASDDDGNTWVEVEGLTRHASREEWQPGGAGLVLHTIVTDRADSGKMWVGVSAAGVFATEDGGATWERRNRLSNVGATEHHPGAGHAGSHDVGLCVHNLVRADASGDVLYQQNHHGVFRSNDGGRSWQSISSGLPSTFGFPIAVHPSDADTAWVLPLNGDTQGRYPPDASAKVWRTRDGGATWQGFAEGLPQRNCFFTVLRQAMATDSGAPSGVYFGTNSGSVFASMDEGETWQEIASHLPTVLSVEVIASA